MIVRLRCSFAKWNTALWTERTIASIGSIGGMTSPKTTAYSMYLQKAHAGSAGAARSDAEMARYMSTAANSESTANPAREVGLQRRTPASLVRLQNGVC